MHAARDRPAPRDGGPSQQDGGPNNLIFGWGMTSSSVVTGMFDLSGSWRGGPNSRDIFRSSIMMMIGWVDKVDLDAMVRGLNKVSGFANVFFFGEKLGQRRGSRLCLLECKVGGQL